MGRKKKPKAKEYKRRKGVLAHPSDAELTRVCGFCKREMPLGSFVYVLRCKFARLPQCLMCRAQMQIDYYYQNRQKCILGMSRWQKKDKEHKNKLNREYYARNREKVTAHVREYSKRRKELAQNTHHSGQCSESPPPQAQNQEVESPPVQSEEFHYSQDYHCLMSYGVFFTLF